MTNEFDLKEGERQASEGMCRAAAAAGTMWNGDARATVLLVADLRTEFTSDDVWQANLEKPQEPRALGAVMAKLAREGRIRKTGRYQKTQQVSRHAAPIAVWEKAS